MVISTGSGLMFSMFRRFIGWKCLECDCRIHRDTGVCGPCWLNLNYEHEVMQEERGYRNMSG